MLLLLGRDCGPAMSTQCFGYRAPYAHRTSLGWALVGEISCGQKLQDKTVLKVQVNHSHCEHWDIGSTFPKKETDYTGILDLFSEKPDDEMSGLSKDDSLFLQKTSNSLYTNEEGNITFPLPFREDVIAMPDNKAAVYGRMSNTLKRIKSDPDKLNQCLDSMGKNIKLHHVEEVPKSELAAAPGKVW